MSELFDELFVSCPNGGGLFFIKERHVFRLDNQETTGISLEDNLVLRAIQPDDLHVYTCNPKIISGKKAGFGDIHDVLIHNGACYIVGTEQNEVVKFSSDGDELQRWKFPGEPDSWHINCLTVWNGRIVFSAFGNFRVHRQYKGNTSKSGFVQDLLSGEILVKDLSQPHSVIAKGTSIILANSEEKEILEFDEKGTLSKSRTLDGYTRGIAVKGDVIYVGISRSRNIDSDHGQGAMIVALDASSFEEIGRIEVPAQEIYTVACRTDAQGTIKTLASICQSSMSIIWDQYQNVFNQTLALTQTIEQRDSEIANLIQCSVDRESEFTELGMALSDRNEQIASLTQIRATSENEISALNNAVGERNEEIAVLKQNSGDRENEIRALNKTISDRDVDIAALKRNVADRDIEISAVNKTLVDRCEEIVTLKQVLSETCNELNRQKEEIAAIKSSLSWKLTKQFRQK